MLLDRGLRGLRDLGELALRALSNHFERGNGMHHLAFRTDSVRGDLARLEEKGIRLIDKEPRHGAHHTQIAFLHPKATQGVLMELTQPDVE